MLYKFVQKKRHVDRIEPPTLGQPSGNLYGWEMKPMHSLSILYTVIGLYAKTQGQDQTTDPGINNRTQ